MMDWDRYDHAVALREAGRPQEALIELRSLANTSADPEENAMVQMAIAHCCRACGNLGEARRALWDAYSTLSTKSCAHLRVKFVEALIEEADGNWKKELDLLDEILDKKHSRLVLEDENQDLKEEVYRHRGVALMGVGRHEEARSLLEAAISDDYEKEVTLYYLGQCYFVLGELKLAKLRIKEALSMGLQPVNELNAHYWLAVVHFRLGEYAWSKLEFEWCLAHLDQGTVARDDILKGLASTDKAMEISQRAN
jgi:tetratricopeptide (TPR) repeat protein